MQVGDWGLSNNAERKVLCLVSFKNVILVATVGRVPHGQQFSRATKLLSFGLIFISCVLYPSQTASHPNPFLLARVPVCDVASVPGF